MRLGREVALLRNYLCPDYDKCLATAAKANDPTLGCCRCSKKDARIKKQLTDMDLVGCLMLLFVIFFPTNRRSVPYDMESLWLLVRDRGFQERLAF